MKDNNFYITTPIYYSNDVPHIGHTSTNVFADVIARYMRGKKKDVLLTTGNDEHGQKVEGSAKKAGKEPQVFVDEMAKEWKRYWGKLGFSYDYFVRTTAKGHKEVVAELLQTLYKSGDIYKGIYEGIYCIGCEEYKTERQLVDGKCPEHRPDQITKIKEENYFFKLSKYALIIKEKIEKNEILVKPENKKKEMLARISSGVEDLSISRPSVSWGIQVPWDKEQTIYVWVEALINYYSSLKILDKEDFWPPNVHVVGKGINWFHSVIWPSMLVALDVSTPKMVFVHSHYNVEGKKMGKSLGNVISPKELINRYGVDGTRYLLAASMPYVDDSDVSFKWFDEKYNADLKNGLGNLISRVSKLANLNNVKGIVDIPSFSDLIKKDEYQSYKDYFDEYKLHKVIEVLGTRISDIDKTLNEKTPWANENKDQAKKDIKELVVNLVELLVLLKPFVPSLCEDKLKGFSSEEIQPAEPSFSALKK